MGDEYKFVVVGGMKHQALRNGLLTKKTYHGERQIRMKSRPPEAPDEEYLAK